MGVTEKSIQAMQGLPFDNLIGGPLNACVKAQADAAQTTLNFINDVGLNHVIDEKTGQETKEAIYVYFSFVQGGRKAVMSVPLLTIVPIPYICINTIDINFKATITGVESSSYTNELSVQKDVESNSTIKKGIFRRKTTNLKTTVSSKRDSKSTRDSSFSIESTIDVSVHASQDSMPAGMAKVLEMLGSSMDLLDPNGELSVNETEFYVKPSEKAKLVAQYKSPMGVFMPKEIKCGNLQGKVNQSDGTVTFELTKGDYDVIVGDGLTHKIPVKVSELVETPAPAGGK